MTLPTPPARRLALVAGFLAVALISCGREITGPGSTTVNAFKRVASFAFSPQYETAVRGPALQAALTQVAFEKVRITLRREDGSIALDTVVDFPAGATELTLSLIVPLPPSTGAGGVPLSLNLGYVNAAGDTVFKGGPFPVTVLPSAGGAAPPPPVQVPVHYTGAGATATKVVISPNSVGGLAGLSTTFSAQALSATGAVMPGTPVVFSSSDPGVVRINDPSSGAANFVGRGTAWVYAQLLTGPLDSAVVTVTLPASALSLVSGGSQTAPAGTTVPLPIVGKVAAADGIGVGGITVSFAAAHGGTVTPASAVSAANGQVSASWKLGSAAGAQSVTLTAAGLSGSPITVNATALAVVATKLVLTTAPVSGLAGSVVPAVAVTAQDALGNTVSTFAGDVSVAIGANPGGSTLGGTTTVTAVNGVATFSNLSLNRPGTGYTFLFSSSTLSSVASAAFNITAGNAARLVFGPMTSTADAGIAMGSVVVTAQDAVGNTVTSFTGDVSVAIGSNPGTSTLSGTLTRTAVAGVATFIDLSLNKKGASYTLTANAPGLTSGTSAAFNVAAGAPTALTIVSGNGQSLPAGSLLSVIEVRLRDALDNGIEGASIALAVTGGGGTLSSATALTDATGVARIVWTIGTGPQAMTATYGALSPITISASSSVGSATQLVITQQPPAAAMAGVTLAPALTVVAKDGSGNIVTSFVNNVTVAIGTNPAGGTLSGTTTKAAVAGVATFNNLSLNKVGVGYTLVFSAIGLTNATSSALSITVAAASQMSADSGAAPPQSGPANQLLPTPLVVRVTDAFGNKVAGTSVTWAVATGGGSLGGTTTTTDTAGRVRAQWTLGPTAGAQTVTATSTGLTGSPLTFSATASATAFSKQWKGITNTDWNTSTNWLPVGIPAAGDSVQIDSVTNMPVLAAATTITKLIMAPGSTLNLGTFNLTVNGSVNAGALSTISGTGKLVLGGTTGSIVGPSFPSVKVQGTYTLAGITGFTSDVEVASGSLSTNGFTANIGGNLITSGTGAIATMSVSDLFDVTGSGSFGGGNIALTTGELRLGGNFAQTAGTFAQSGGLTKFVGAAAKTVSFIDTTAASFFFNAKNSGTGAVTLNTPIRAKGVLESFVGAGNWIGTGKAARTATLVLGSTTQFAVDTLDVWQASSLFVPSGLTATLVVSGGAVTLGTGFTLNGSLIVSGSGQLDLNGQMVTVTGTFSTKGSGKLQMQNASNLDQLIVNGDISFAGGSTSGLLTNGTIKARGNFSQTTNAQAFSAAWPHTVLFDGTAAANQGISFANPDSSFGASCSASCFGHVEAAKSVSQGGILINTAMKATGSIDFSGTGDSVSVGLPALNSHLVIAFGNFTSGAGTGRRFSRVAAGGIVTTGVGLILDTLIYIGNGQGLNPNMLNGVVNNVRVSGSGNTLIGTVGQYSGSVVIDGATAMLDVTSTGAGTELLGTVKTINGGRLHMTDVTDTLLVNNIDFSGGSTAGTLTAGVLKVVGNFSSTGTAFDASGSHVVAMISASTPQVLSSDPGSTTVGFQNLVFGGSAAKDVLMSGGWAINVKGKLVAQPTSGVVGSSNALSQVWMKTGGAVIDSTAADTAFKFARLMVDSVTALPRELRVGDLMISGTQLLFDSLRTTASVTVNGGLLDLNGHTLRLIGSNAPFLTSSGGRLKMMNPLDSLSVDNGNGMFFVGGSTAGMLTDGGIRATGTFQTGGAGANAQSFAATGNHAVSFEGAGHKRLRMLNGGFAGSHFGELYHGFTDTLYLKTDVYAESFETGIVANHFVRADTSFSPLLVAKGADIRDVVFDGVRFELNNGEAVTDLFHVSFLNQDPLATQFAIKRSGTGSASPTAGSITALSGAWTFATTPTTGKYLDAQDTDGGSPDALYVNFSGTVSPTTHGGKASFSGTASSNWNNAGVYASVGVGGNWTNPLSWSPNGVPGMFDDVTIGLSTSIVLTAGAMVHNLTVSGGTLNVDNNALMVRGDVAVGSSTVNIGTGGTLAMTGGGARNLNAGFLRNIFVDTNTVVTLQSNLQVNGNAVIAGRLIVNGHTLTVSDGSNPPSGQLIVQPGGGLKMTQALDSVFVAHATFGGVASDTLLTAGFLSIANNFTQSGDPQSFAPTGTHITELTADGFDNSAVRAAVETAVPGGRRRSIVVNTLTFANPGYAASRFNVLRITQNNDISLGTDVYALRAEALDAANSRYLFGSGYKLFIKDGTLVGLKFNGPGLQVDSANTATQLDSLSFVTAPVTADQLTLNAIGGAAPTFTNLAFGTAPTTGHYLVINGAATATMVNPKPGAHGGFVVKTGGAAIAGWIASRNMTAASGGAWYTPGTWSPVGIPSRHDTVTINTGASVTLDANGALNDMVMLPGAALTIPSFTTLDVYGNWTSDTTSTVTGLAISSYTNFWGNAQVRGRLFGAGVAKSMTLIGRTIFDGYVSVGDYVYTPITFDVNGQTATMNAGFSTYYGGRLKMTNAAGVLNLRGGASFTGGSTDGLLTDGTLRIDSTFYASAAAFAATGNHTTIVSSMGSASNSIRFDGPGATNTLGHFGILHFADSTHNTFLKSDVWAVTKLTSAVTSPSINIYRDGAYPAATAASLHVADVNSTGLLNFVRVALDVYDVKATSAFSNAWFQGFTATANEVQLAVTSTSATPISVNMSALNFLTPSVNTYRYLEATSLGSGLLTLNLTSMLQTYATMSSQVATGGAPTPVINWTP